MISWAQIAHVPEKYNQHVASPGGARVSRPIFFCNLHHARDVLLLPGIERAICESQRDSAVKPRVARNELPWVVVRQIFPTATRLRPFRFRPRTNSHNLVEIILFVRLITQRSRRNVGLEVAIPLGLATMICLGITLVMPQSLSAVYIHLVFSTKDRRPLLRDKTTREALHSYLGGISKQLDCPPILVGGVEDHIHLLARFGRTITQAEWVKELKRVSNAWLKERGRDFVDFEWQGGYADFSVSQSNLEPVKQYIIGQEEHHRKIGFQDELRALLKRHEIEWDEKYVWD
jgi:REP-associated tyrosine transposase